MFITCYTHTHTHVYVYDLGPGEAHIYTCMYMKVCLCACPPATEGDVGLILGSRRSPGGGNGNPLQCSSLENPVDMDRGAWWATVHGVAKSQTWLSHLTIIATAHAYVHIQRYVCELWLKEHNFVFSWFCVLRIFIAIHILTHACKQMHVFSHKTPLIYSHFNKILIDILFEIWS